MNRTPDLSNDNCRMCAYFCSEWCYNYENPENCKDWKLSNYPITLLTDSPETIEHVHKLYRQWMLKKGYV